MRLRGNKNLALALLFVGAALAGLTLGGYLGGTGLAQESPGEARAHLELAQAEHAAPAHAEVPGEPALSAEETHGAPADDAGPHETPAGERATGSPAHDEGGHSPAGEHATAASTHGEGGHGEGEGAHEGAPELPNMITILYAYFGDALWVKILHRFENVFFAALAALVLGLVVHRAFTRRSHRPGKLQSLVELAVEGLDNLVCGILGHEGRRFVPFVGTLFIYILFMNLMGLVPFLKSPTSSIDITASMAICVFLYVQYTGLRNFGFLGYLNHLAGNPRDPITWALVPIMIPLHVIGELAKPLSLSLRLFGNITGEDILLAVFVGLGAASLHFTHLPVGIPFQVPLIFLAILTSVIQALVFTLLSTVYFLLMQEHEEEAH